MPLGPSMRRTLSANRLQSRGICLQEITNMQEKKVPNRLTDNLPVAGPDHSKSDMSPEDKETATQMIDFLQALLKDVKTDQESQQADQASCDE